MIGALWTALRAWVVPWFSAGWLRMVVPLIVVALVAFGGWRVSVWHDSHKSLQATKKALAECSAAALATEKAYQEAKTKAEAKAAADKLASEETKRELETKLAAADTGARDLARRLRDYQARRCGGSVSSAAGASSGTAGSPEESGDGEAIERATSDHLVACAVDAARLEGWQKWWGKVSR